MSSFGPVPSPRATEELSLEEGPYPEKEKLTAFSHILIVETEF